jgi:PAS domain S-box-containing protein
LEAQSEHLAEEVKRLQRCVNDLVSVLSLPAVWSGGDRAQVVRTLLDVLGGMLRLDLVYVRLNSSLHEAPVEMVRVAQSLKLPSRAQEIGEVLNRWLGTDQHNWAPLILNPFGHGDMSIIPLQLGLHGELGVIVTASERLDFPQNTESLVMTVAANQAAIGLQDARLLDEQKRLANLFDQRVAQRTRELATINDNLRKEVAERNRAQEELKTSEARKSAILDSALDCIMTVDHEGRITEFNTAAQRTFGYCRNEIVGKQLSDTIVPPSLRGQHHLGFAHYMATGEARMIGRRIEMTALRADGSEFPIELSITRTPLEGPPSFAGYLRDITERKRAEQKLRESELRLRQLTETIPEMLWSATPDGAIDYCNARVLDYTGFSAEEILDDGWTKLLHPDDIDHTTREWTFCVTTGAPYRVEVRTFHAADHTYRWCVTSALPLRDDQGDILKWHGTVVDMHDWRQAQEELRNTQAELAHAARVLTVGELTASIAHEIKQPLASIRTNAGTGLRLLAQPVPDVEGARELIERVVTDTRRASEIINGIRAMARRQTPEQVLLSLDDVIKETMTFLRHELTARGVSVSLDLARELPKVVADRTQLQQVFVNLSINSAQAMAQSEGRSILIRTSSVPEAVSCSIEDSGPGINPEQLPRLFDRFFTTKETGMGLGLSISQSIIEAHGGYIHADNNSALGGARFSFVLPANGLG